MGVTLITQKYHIVFHGSSINIIDIDNHNIIARFKDLKYAYRGILHPNKNIFVAKSNDGTLASYSLDTMKLLSKYKKRGVRAPQDGNFCFDPQGNFFNIEYNVDTLLSTVVMHDGITLEEKYRYFASEPVVLDVIKYDDKESCIYLVGFERLHPNDLPNSENKFFEMFVEGEKIIQKDYITRKKYDYLYYCYKAGSWFR